LGPVVAEALAGASDSELDALNAARRSTADVLDRMAEAEWQREGTHSEIGR